MGRRYFSDKIVEWYVDNRRSLPWRETTDPYKIWLSEVILQQTRVVQGIPYYQQFTKTYPGIKKIAEAPEQEILRLWQGLGYYTRARNLHRCAKAIVARYSGKFPETFEELRKLPGIGDYTAAAIASFAFGERVAVLDGNVFRVLSRVFGIDTPINSPEGKKEFSLLANELVSESNPGLHNQAVMEFGALFCTPQNPKCQDCPFKNTCIARRHDLIPLLPVKKQGKKSRIRYFFYLVVEKNRTFLMKKRKEKDIWHGLFDFVLIEKTKPVNPGRVVMEEENKKWFQEVEDIRISKRYKHILTHQTIHCRFIHIKTKRPFVPGDKDLSFYSARQIARLPKPALISRFLDEQNEH